MNSHQYSAHLQGCLCTATADRHNKLQLQLIQTGEAGDHHFLCITVPELTFYLENSDLPVRPLPASPPLKEDLKHNGHTVSLPTSGPVTYMASIPTR
ncbi:hypothetical protein AMECASPLE_002847 [Ameca splendens]|uniref:Uncharacterized protein n=1 Tax=Ameca splendens TaxID=208324 RepID=A0ABV0YL24_9TELE